MTVQFLFTCKYLRTIVSLKPTLSTVCDPVLIALSLGVALKVKRSGITALREGLSLLRVWKRERPA